MLHGLNNCRMLDDVRSILKKAWAVIWPDSTAVPLTEKLLSSLGVVAALFLASVITPLMSFGPGTPLLVASMGASSVLMFAFPTSPFAQPWPFVAGNFVSAGVAILCVHFLPSTALSHALTVGLAVLAMFIARCVHPPGGATALALALGSNYLPTPDVHYLLVPLAANIVIVLASAFIINNVLPGRHYPARRAAPSPHLLANPPPLQRAGIDSEDVRYALQQFPRPLDVSFEEVEKLIQLAESNAFRQRLPEIRCQDIMSSDLLTVPPEADMDTLWNILKRHKVGAIPVVDEGRHLLGLVTVVDILTRGNFRRNQGFEESVDVSVQKTAGDIMASPVVSVRDTDHVVEVVPLLSERGYHHVPVVDEQGRVAGMITQSDLIGTLYRCR